MSFCGLDCESQESQTTDTTNQMVALIEFMSGSMMGNVLSDPDAVTFEMWMFRVILLGFVDHHATGLGFACNPSRALEQKSVLVSAQVCAFLLTSGCLELLLDCLAKLPFLAKYLNAPRPHVIL